MRMPMTFLSQPGHAARARSWHHEADLLADSADDDGLTEGQRAGLLRLAGAATRWARRERFRAGRDGGVGGRVLAVPAS